MAKFKISEFKNPSGSIVYKVSGSIQGKQIRKNFKTRKDAVASRDLYEIQRLNAEPNVRTVASRLSPEEITQAESAFNILKQAGREKSLTFYVQFAVDNCNEAELSKTVGEALP